MKTNLEEIEAQKSSPAPGANTRGRRRAFTVFFLIVLVAAIAGLIYWLHARQFESTERRTEAIGVEIRSADDFERNRRSSPFRKIRSFQ